jgi:hypothetical protein
MKRNFLRFSLVLLCILIFPAGREPASNLHHTVKQNWTFCKALQPSLIKQLKISYRTKEKGIIIVMTSSNHKIVEKLHKGIEKCFVRAVKASRSKENTCELSESSIVYKKVEILNNGALLELISENNDMITILQNFRFLNSNKLNKKRL